MLAPCLEGFSCVQREHQPVGVCHVFHMKVLMAGNLLSDRQLTCFSSMPGLDSCKKS